MKYNIYETPNLSVAKVIIVKQIRCPQKQKS